MQFVKIQGNGNDFIVIENFDSELTSGFLSRLARKICTRHHSVGADGILVIENSKSSDFRMRLFNSDGSEGEMCGNGARCIARYAAEKGHADKKMSFETLAGVINAEVSGTDVTLDMGYINLNDATWNGSAEVKGKIYEYSFLTVGVPHCVIFYDNCLREDRQVLVEIGRAVRNRQDLFAEGTNVNFVEVSGNETINSVTYERGVEDLTESCGTGSTASALAAVYKFSLKAPIKVTNPGGINKVHIESRKDSEIIRAGLEGKTVIVLSGELTEEALN